jgi:hypothetical protein
MKWLAQAAAAKGSERCRRVLVSETSKVGEQGWNVKIVGPEPIYEARKSEKAERMADLNLETRRNGRMPRARFRQVRL